MDIVRLALMLASIAAIRVARAEEQPVVVGSGGSLPPVAEDSSMACRVISQESVIGEWIRQVRECNRGPFQMPMRFCVIMSPKM